MCIFLCDNNSMLIHDLVNICDPLLSHVWWNNSAGSESSSFIEFTSSSSFPFLSFRCFASVLFNGNAQWIKLKIR